MAKYDPAYANSSGYFKDPITGDDLSADMERAVKCELKDGKFIWPMVLRSDGEELLKIVYKYFTDEEKDLYKQYRGRPTGTSTTHAHRAPKPKAVVQDSPKAVVQEQVQEQVQEPEQVIKYSSDSATSLNTLMLLAECNESYGVSWIKGIAYGLVGKHGENKIYHIPRSCIPDEEWDRICEEGRQWMRQ